MLKLILLISLISTIITHNERKSFKELIDIYLNKLDINDAYLSYDQYISLLKTLKEDYPNYLELSSIGKTYEGNEMPLIIMKSPIMANEELPKINSTEIYKIDKNNSNNSNETYLIDNSLYNKTGIFFNGMHHGREPVSMMMNIYLILHLLSLPKAYLHLFLSSTNIYFVPIINIDAYKYNSEKYLSTSSLQYADIRKNRKPHRNIICSQEKDLGVDLNRNYDYYFGDNNKGSSNSPCDEQYRGEYPFSEPETNNIKNFVDIHPDIKITFNYHTWGNLIITPFNYLKGNESLTLLQKDYPIHYKMYQDFKNEANFPDNFLFGNSDKTIFYMTNGDATDWYLGKKKILSFSPELGNGKKDSDLFYPNKNITFDVMEKNLYSALYAIQKSMFYLKTELIKAEYSPCMYKTRYSDIYFNNQKYGNNNLRDIELRNCFVDEVILYAKVKMTNYGFGTYKPGIEFNYNQINHGNNNTNENENKKYFYFLALDLQVNLDNIKSICYWSVLLNNTNKEDNNKFNKNNDTQKDDLKIRCATNKGDELNDMKLFIDTEIKSLESIIINIQIILKKETFNERKDFINRKKNHRFLGNINNNNNTNNSENNNNTNINETSDLIKLYTKKGRIIKSENLNGEIIEWKFNAPSIIIKFEDFNETRNTQLIIIRQNPFRFITYMICSFSIMVFFMCRIIKILSLREMNDMPNNSVNERRELNRNNNNNVVNYFEDINQFQNNYQRNNQSNHNNNAYQIARDESENSNSDSP